MFEGRMETELFVLLADSESLAPRGPALEESPLVKPLGGPVAPRPGPTVLQRKAATLLTLLTLLMNSRPLSSPGSLRCGRFARAWPCWGLCVLGLCVLGISGSSFVAWTIPTASLGHTFLGTPRPSSLDQGFLFPSPREPHMLR